MIELHRVSKIYEVGPVKVPALSDVSFTIDKGEFVVINGPSGAGKTTLMRLLYREEEPTDGEVIVLGQPLAELTPREVSAFRRTIGVVFQDAKLSQGEAQRAALARAIVRKQALLIADEPTGNLDDGMAAEVVSVIKDIWAGGTTVILATHQSRLAVAMRRRTL